MSKFIDRDNYHDWYTRRQNTIRNNRVHSRLNNSIREGLHRRSIREGMESGYNNSALDTNDENEDWGAIKVVRSEGGFDWVEIEYPDWARVFWGEKSQHLVTYNTTAYAYVPMGSVEYELFDLVSEMCGVDDEVVVKRTVEADFEGWCKTFSKELHDIFFEYAVMQCGVYIEWADGEKTPGFHFASLDSVIARSL